MASSQHQQWHAGATSATYMPGALDNDYYLPPTPPVLVAPEPQRIQPEMSNQIADGLRNLDLNSIRPPSYARLSTASELPHFSLFPKLTNKPNWLPPSDEEVEATLDSARHTVLNSTDPEMQLAWAQDALIYVAVCAEDAERRASTKHGYQRPQTPRVEHQLKVDAMSIVNFLADQHHPRAEFIRGMWFESGRYGQREDKKEAFRCYNRAADRQYHRAHFRIGMLYESYNDPAKALRHYNLGVDAADSACCYRLGMMTLHGQHGQPQDYSKAVDLLRKSADSADENAPQGAYVYGMLLARQLPQITLPEGILPYNESSARHYIQKAAYLKFAKAQTMMGSMFELGSLGCEFSPSYSVHYNALASKQGEVDADMALSKWFLVGHEGLFPKNEELAYTYAERAARGGLPTAEFALGYFYEIGMHVPADLGKSVEWYQKAWRHGNEDAKSRIDGIERKQILSKTDHEKVAINRIKSQRGSMIGAKPDWLKYQTEARLQQQQQQKLQQLPTIQQEQSHGPENNQIYSPSVYGTTPATPRPPPLKDTTTPYPMDNGPPVAPPVRPATVTPYPMDDHNNQFGDNRPGPTGGFFNPQSQPPPRPNTTLNPQIRPSSAFQLSPEFQQGHFQSQPYSHGQPQPYGSSHYGQPDRPATVQPLNPTNQLDRPLSNNRIVSGPAAPQGYNQHVQRPQPGSQHVDIGYVAPLDDHRRRPQPQQQQQHSSPPQPQHQFHHQSQRPTTASSKPQTPTIPNLNAPSSGAPGRTSARPHHSPNPDGRKPVPPSKAAAASTTPNSRPSTASTTASTTKPSSRPPGSGPKTFEEMGVPAGKQESECVVM